MPETLTALSARLRQGLSAVASNPAQAQTEADWILDAVLGLSPAAVIARGDESVSDTDRAAVDHLLRMRVEKRIPLQYLLHEAHFFGLHLYVNPHVLIPRPETELLVEAALEQARPGCRILDVGTGSGAIALALAHRLGETARVTGVDFSNQALKVARLNLKRLGVSVNFRPAGDLFDPVAGERFDCIVSNPPYVNVTLADTLAPEVREHEPHTALFAPPDDPLHFYKRIAREAPAHLNPGGWVMVELGAGMAPAVQAVFAQAGYAPLHVKRDYAGHERILLAGWPG